MTKVSWLGPLVGGWVGTFINDDPDADVQPCRPPLLRERRLHVDRRLRRVHLLLVARLDPVVAVVMLALFIFMVMLGFPIAFTLVAMGLGFGYYAYYDPE